MQLITSPTIQLSYPASLRSLTKLSAYYYEIAFKFKVNLPNNRPPLVSGENPKGILKFRATVLSKLRVYLIIGRE